jgi:hypothetical protein
MLDRKVHKNISKVNKGKIIDEILTHQYGNVLVKHQGEPKELA